VIVQEPAARYSTLEAQPASYLTVQGAATSDLTVQAGRHLTMATGGSTPSSNPVQSLSNAIAVFSQALQSTVTPGNPSHASPSGSADSR